MRSFSRIRAHQSLHHGWRNLFQCGGCTSTL